MLPQALIRSRLHSYLVLIVLLLIGGTLSVQAGTSESCTFEDGVYGLIVDVGDTRQFNFTFFSPPHGQKIVEMIYSSVLHPSGDPVISVSTTGLITAIAPGHTRWQVQAVTEPQWPVNPYPFEVCVPGGALDLPRITPSATTHEIGETYRVEVDPGDHIIRTLSYQVSYERDDWATQYWTGPVITFDNITKVATAREPGSARILVDVGYAAPGSAHIQSMQIPLSIYVLTPLAGIGFNDMYGQVVVIPVDDPDDFFTANLDSPLRVGDIVETRINSGAILSLRDMTSFVMPANSAVRIGGQSPTESKLQLLVGHVWANVKQILEDGSMDIEMSQAVAGIKATTFVVADDGATSSIKVFEGAVEFVASATGETVLVSAGQTSDATAAGLSVLSAFDIEAELESWDDRVQAWTREAMSDTLVAGDAARALDDASLTRAKKEEDTKDTDLPAELVALASQGQLTVRALRGWGQLPERFSQLALELRQHDIDLLGADLTVVEALLARATETPYLSNRVNALEDLAQLLADYALPDPDPMLEGADVFKPATRTTETLPPDGAPGWILVSTEDRSAQNSDSSQSTFSLSLLSDSASDRAQVRQSRQGYSRVVHLAFDYSWDQPPQYAFKQDTWQGRIELRDVGSSVEYLSGSAPETDPKSGGFAFGAQYWSGTRPITGPGSAATGRFSPDNPDSTGTPVGEAEIRWPDRGCPGDQFTIEMRVSAWSGRGTLVWTYEYHPNLLQSPIFIEQFNALQAEQPPAPDHARADPEIIQDCLECPEMVVIPAGHFLMGSPDSEYGRQEHEGPQTNITIAYDFAMARTPVTQAQWSALMDSTTFRFPDCPDCPADNISHAEAQQYLRRLSNKTGQEYRLPSAAEWEYACRAGTDLRYCGSNDIDEVAWYRCNSDNQTQPVAGKAANAFGLHDMSGNVMEWTLDCFTPTYDLMPTEGQPLRESSYCSRMISRGGSWFSTEDYVRAAARSSGGMMGMGEDGFRPLRVLTNPDSSNSEVAN